MKVKLKRAWFIEGHRWSRPGEHDIPDRFRDQLPSDAEIVEEGKKAKAAAAAEPAPAPEPDSGEKPKGYRLMPKEIAVDGHDPVDTQSALKLAVKASGKSVADWNKLDEADRKRRIIKAAGDIVAT